MSRTILKKLTRKIVDLLFIVACFTFISSQCKDEMDCRLKIINNSEVQIKYIIDCFNNPDTLYLGSCHSGDVIGGSSKEECVNTSWNNYYYKVDYLKIFIIEKDTLEKYQLDVVFSANKFSKKYKLTEDEIVALDWAITYP